MLYVQRYLLVWHVYVHLCSMYSRRTFLLTEKDKVGWPDVGTLEWAPQVQPISTNACSQYMKHWLSLQQDIGVKFVAMAVLHSEVLLVDSDGQLRSWRCDGVSCVTPHPLTESLGLAEERVRLVESGGVRATVVTEKGRVATFYDSLLRGKTRSRRTYVRTVRSLVGDIYRVCTTVYVHARAHTPRAIYQ